MVITDRRDGFKTFCAWIARSRSSVPVAVESTASIVLALLNLEDSEHDDFEV